MKRYCHTCLVYEQSVEATHVARDPEGLEWFECDKHGPTDNIAQLTRVSIQPIREWFEQHGIPFDEPDPEDRPPPTQRNPVTAGDEPD